MRRLSEAQGEQRFSAWKRLPTCQGTPLVEWWKRSTTSIPLLRSPLYDLYYADQSPVSNHSPALGRQLSGSLAHGAKLIAQFLGQEPTPLKMATFAQELKTL
jgi:hypothetical protein